MICRQAVPYLLLLVLPCVVYGQQQTGAPAGLRGPAAPATSSLGVTAGSDGHALHYRVRVVDGRTGVAIQNAHVRLWFDEPTGAGYEFATDASGVGLMPAPVSQPLRVLVSVLDYMDCRRFMRGDPPIGYNLLVIAKEGMTGQNGCGTIAVHASAGELVLFARHSRWYEGINRNMAN